MMTKRTVAIGDIHGCHIALERLLEELKISPSDTIVVLGDVVDRGPGTKQAIDRLIELQSECEVVFLMGNHEEMMLESRDGSGIERMWLRYGGRETLNSYGGGYGLVPETHWKFLKTARNYWETESEIFIHANLQPGVPLPSQTIDWLRWTRISGKETPRDCGRRVICGHSSLDAGVPLVMKGWVCIDTWCYGNQYLTALDVTNDLVYQAKQTGETRPPVPLDTFGQSSETEKQE
ncbi:MAG: serine/threonine protein phosphatase [Planctomycetaceae bacterium]|nr:serine/threonine protein phosphatase [Planctomycetaceae bacterium]